jgi:cytochrome oxidase Cu insertion factor (SCO1/SenC/PrrC family)
LTARTATVLGLLAAAGASLLWRAAPGPAGAAAVPDSSADDAGPLPVLYPLPDFDLVESGGARLRRADLVGRPFVAAFIFTRCAGICPRMTAHMARLRGELPEAVRLVSFTVDPVHDTPEVLARHARALQAGPRWLFVTGTQAELYRLAVEGFKLATQELPAAQAAAEGPFLHSPRLVLVDEQARVRGYYDTADESQMGALVRDAAGRLAPLTSAP